MTIVRVPIDLSWSGASGSPGVNVFHGRFDQSVPPFTGLEGMTGALLDFYTALASIYNTDVSIRFLGEAAGVGPDEGNTYTATPWTVNGLGGTDHLAPALQMYINWRATTGGRRGRGRSFIGPLQDAVSESNGTPDEGVRADVQDAVDALISESLLDNGWAVGVWSRLDLVLRDFVSGAVPNKFAVLRTRRD